MPGFSGTIFLPGETGSGLQATAYVESDRLTLTCATGQLGAWALREVAVEREAPDRFALAVEGERIVFLPEEPEGFARFAQTATPGDGEVVRKGRENGPPAEDGTGSGPISFRLAEEAPREPADPFEWRVPEPSSAGASESEPEAVHPEPEPSHPKPEAVHAKPEPEPEAVHAKPEALPPRATTRRSRSDSSRSLISESAATIGLVVLLAMLGTAGVALLFGVWSPFDGAEESGPAGAALPARTVGDLGMTGEELRVAWNRAARRTGSGLQVPALLVDRRPDGDVFRYPFQRDVLLTGETDGASGPVREVSVVGTVSDARAALHLVEAWHVLLATADETLDEAARRRILHELGAFSSDPTGGSVVFGDVRYTLVVSPAVGTWLTVTPAG